MDQGGKFKQKENNLSFRSKQWCKTREGLSPILFNIEEKLLIKHRNYSLEEKLKMTITAQGGAKISEKINLLAYAGVVAILAKGNEDLKELTKIIL